MTYKYKPDSDDLRLIAAIVLLTIAILTLFI